MMKKWWMVFSIAALGLGLAGLTGCQKEEPATPEEALKQAAEQPAAAMPAAQQPPKDHPAH